MNEAEMKAMDRLRRAHDDLKQCRFRSTLSEEDLGEYSTQLWELSHAWTDLCWHVDRDEAEQRQMQGFCHWIHDYNGIILRARNLGVVRYWVPYFEAVLNVTHNFLDTGYMDVFYNPYVYADGKRLEDVHKIGRWCLVTSDMCGIESQILPRYFPVTLPLCTDLEKMEKYFLKERWYRFKDVSVEQRTKDYKEWEQNVRPILIWINEHLVPRSAREGDVTSSLFYSDPT